MVKKVERVKKTRAATPVLQVTARLMIPYILLFAFYVLMHGKVSAGGGFQAGVIFASAFVLYALVFGVSRLLKFISTEALLMFAAMGVLIYGGTGVASLFLHKNYLDYTAFHANPATGQVIGVVMVELGVGITVSAVMLLLFVLFISRGSKEV